MTKDEVRDEARRLGLRTADKPDSQDVCFITSREGRSRFLADRIEVTPADVVDGDGRPVGRVDAVELVTIGQRRGLGLAGGTPPRFVTEVDPGSGPGPALVTIGGREDLLTEVTPLAPPTWVDEPVTGPVIAQTSAHGDPAAATLHDDTVLWTDPRPRVAPGQTVAFYDPNAPDQVLGAAIAG
jgi:tRNA-specific 2-thiouridylase